MLTLTKRKTKQIFPELDRYCGEILFRLILIGRKVRFKDLREFLIESGASLSKPTLSNHLKHLTEKKLVVRKIEDVHNVSYEVNHELFEEFKKYAKSALKSERAIAEEKKAFVSKSVNGQIDDVFENMMLRNLDQLKANIELELNPSKKMESSLILMLLNNPFFYRYETWLITKCKEDRDYGEKVLQKLDKFIKEIKKDLKSGSSQSFDFDAGED